MTSEDKAKILIVDDVPGKLMAIAAVLESLDQTIVAVTSGAACNRLIASRPVSAETVTMS